MVDGVVDADRLDYVYRDAAVTIGSLSRPRTVLESIVGYIPGGVIVNDPRPVTDFLSTRMRLWTFVYNSPDVRFMHALLKTVLDGQCDRPQALEAFKKAKLEPELTQPKFMSLDDSSLMERVEKLDVEHLEQYRQEARKLIQTGTFDYECLVLKRQETGASEETTYNLPSELFFDLMFDERQHQLYRSQTVFVRQVLTSKIDERVPLEQSAGAFAPLFAEGNSAMLVRGGFFVFQPRKRSGLQWEPVRRAMESGSLFDRLEQEDAQRSLSCPSDTRKIPGFKGTPVSVSYCFKDWPIVVRIVRELHKRKRRYHIILRQSDGIGGTATGNSQQLVRGSKAILVVASAEYLRRAGNANTYIGMEVDEIFATGSDKPKAVLCADTREELDAIPEWNWGRLDTQWRGEAVVASSTNPLRDASTESISRDVAEALRQIDAWKGKR
jgi:hypothetical protein